MTVNGTATTLRDYLFRFFSWFYGAGTWLRNKLFDWGLLKQHEFEIPVIVVGNIAVGGTGKTPHVEYIVAKLSTQYNIGVIIRGYKRSTNGFILATDTSTPNDIGDEPYQIFNKFHGRIRLAVSEDRVFGIRELRRLYPDINMIILDDGFQHRHVKPDLSIVLMEYRNMPYDDHLLPYGRLRESIDALRRASIIVVTKCPETINPIDFRLVKNNLNLYPSQGLYFSRYQYGSLVPLFSDFVEEAPRLSDFTADDTFMTITGIAHPKPFTRHLRNNYQATVKSIRFPDHYNFVRSDFDFITSKFNELKGRRKIIITTEKDAVRMVNNPYFPQELKNKVFYLPIHVEFIPYLNDDFSEGFYKHLREIPLSKQRRAAATPKSNDNR